MNRKLFMLWHDGELYIKQLIKHGDQWLARSHNAEHTAKYPDFLLRRPPKIEGRLFLVRLRTLGFPKCRRAAHFIGVTK